MTRFSTFVCETVKKPGITGCTSIGLYYMHYVTCINCRLIYNTSRSIIKSAKLSVLYSIELSMTIFLKNNLTNNISQLSYNYDLKREIVSQILMDRDKPAYHISHQNTKIELTSQNIDLHY